PPFFIGSPAGLTANNRYLGFCLPAHILADAASCLSLRLAASRSSQSRENRIEIAKAIRACAPAPLSRNNSPRFGTARTNVQKLSLPRSTPSISSVAYIRSLTAVTTSPSAARLWAESRIASAASAVGSRLEDASSTIGLPGVRP